MSCFSTQTLLKSDKSQKVYDFHSALTWKKSKWPSLCVHQPHNNTTVQHTHHHNTIYGSTMAISWSNLCFFSTFFDVTRSNITITYYIRWLPIFSNLYCGRTSILQIDDNIVYSRHPKKPSHVRGFFFVL